jgi:aspartate/methionine/tyrosine aminotransferase
MSKAYSLAGIRVGWIASRSCDLIEQIASARHYTLISVSQLDEQVAAFALDASTVHGLLGRNIRLAKTNLEILERFMVKNDEACEWVKPVAGTTAFVRFHKDGKAVDAIDFCKRVMERTGVMFVPGDYCFGEEFKGYVRIGFVNRTEVVKEGLDKVTQFLRKEFDDVKLAE